ncbi:MAG: aminotransferase class III-fold pyridoxal phosphate-dependent enzyme, partial [Caldilineaceae bacterium]|nr:aminotransferase class III-fold pyridoxal phosphate-dependent enzyme [Caldilineaceae bacterium]
MSQISTSERSPRVEAAVKAILLELSGFNLDELDKSVTFLELGFDSLFLIQFSQALKKKLNLKISFRQLIEEIGNFSGLITYVAQKAEDSVLPAAPVAQAPAAAQVPAANAAPSSSAPAVDPPMVMMPASSPSAQSMPIMSSAAPLNPSDLSGLEAIMAHQLQVMAQQLDMLRVYQGSAPAVAPTPMPAPAPTNETSAAPALNPEIDQSVSVPVPTQTKPDVAQLERKRFGPYKPIKRGKDGGLTERQQKHLDALVQRFCARTAKSKELAQEHRPYFADPRGIAGFRQLWKEMVYQITTVRSEGAKLWDIDGNEYIDVAMGFGLNLFGQSPEFITKAVADQLALGVEIGPQSPLAGEVAKLMCELTGMDRVTFCNTGSEAVMAAIRLARTVSGRTKFAFFSSAYHGNFDQVIVRASVVGGQRRMAPAAPGVPDNMADNVLVLDYGDPASLDILRAHAHELAAVLVEPVQSAQPDLQPREFLHDLRALTAEADIALVIDEVITGFRAAPGGAQEWFGIQADMATYGKIIGGGMPMGALAGKGKYMDALDSGMWQYGDDSVPEEDMTFFAGTFVRHPLALAAAKVVL